MKSHQENGDIKPSVIPPTANAVGAQYQHALAKQCLGQPGAGDTNPLGLADRLEALLAKR